MVLPKRAPRPAIYQSAEAIYHADTCDRLKQAAAQEDLRLAGFGRRGYPGESFPQGVLPEVASIGYWDAPRNQSWGLDWHRNEGIELTFLARGRLDFAADSDAYLLTAGDLTITRPWQKHRLGHPHIHASRLHWVILDLEVRRPNQTWQWPPWLVFSSEDLKRLTTLLRHCEQPVWKATPAIRRHFEEIASQLDTGDPPRSATPLKILLNSALYDLMLMLKSKRITLEPGLASNRRAVELFLQSLPEHLDHLWTLETMAEHCGLGRSRFAHYCQEITNLSPLKYLNRCRLETAARLLRQSPDLSVTDVALACGYSSSQYFANNFRRAFGTTPSAVSRYSLNSERSGRAKSQ